jgi:hypothetical protein
MQARHYLSFSWNWTVIFEALNKYLGGFMTASPKGSPDSNSLEVVRQQYQYNYTHIPPLAMLDILPEVILQLLKIC